MAGPSPRDEYNPVPTISPQIGAPNDYLSQKSSPNAFGGQIGDATQKLGQTVTDTGTKAVDVAVQYQGVLNEAASNAADLQLATAGGKINDSYKTLTGFDAANAKDKAVSDLTQLNQKIRSQLNPAAARSYDQLANRRLSYTIADMNSYAADQTKSALKGGNVAAQSLAVDEASKYDVASNDSRFGSTIGDVRHLVAEELTAPVYGRYQNTPVTQNSDGSLTFDQSTPEGRVAQADYQNTMNTVLDKVWSNRADGLAFDINHGSYSAALKMISDNKDQMGASTFSKLSQKFYGPAQTERIHGDNESLLSQAHTEYLNQAGTQAPSNPNNIGNVKAASGGFANPATPTDGVILTTNNLRGQLYQGKTLAQIGQTWEGTSPSNIQNWVNKVSSISGISPTVIPNLSDPNTLNHLVKGIMTAEKSSGDQKLFPDDVINTGVSHALSGQKANLNPQNSTGTARNEVDYMSMHEPELIQSARQAVIDRGGDATLQDQAAGQMETRINEIRSAQAGESKALSDGIISLVMDTKNNGKNPMTSEFPLMYGDPQTRQDYANALNQNLGLANTVRQLTAANALGQSKTYGTNSYQIVQDVLQGKVTDPSQLGDYGIGGDKAPLSASGFQAMAKLVNGTQTPQEQAFAKDESAFFKKMHDTTTGANIFPGSSNAAGEARMNTFLETALPQIEAERAKGKTSADLFDPKSPDYIGRFLKVPTAAAMFNELSGSLANQAASAPPVTYNTLSDLQKAVKGNKITRQAATDLALKNHWIQPNPPSVPLPQ